ncbi:hypothetical protein [Rathayibacter sp. PhB127]|uniref:hypothetical protein n=1 Tax=Rathayibacter sp. PhB127 TaxID=2485176 RepID=UPI0011CE4D16|nr:hypothetical protein [Rathayibacter sp. PhB127]
MTTSFFMAILVPFFIWVLWLAVVRRKDGGNLPSRLAWALASGTGILVMFGTATSKFAEPATDRDILTSDMSFARLDGCFLIAGAVVSTLILLVLFFASGEGGGDTPTQSEKSPKTEKDASHRLGDDW